MIILGIDSASISACCGVMKDGKMLSEGFVNSGLTHSQTLLPLIEKTCKEAKIEIKDVDLISITNGPGSFTGLRIGLSTVKGMASPFSTKCVGISSLEAIALSGSYSAANSIICAVMDARCKQVYNALFELKNGNLIRICEDRAISIEQLKSELEKYKEDIILCGDGAEICLNNINDYNIKKAKSEFLLPIGKAVCSLGEQYQINAVSPENINPIYLRLPQAQRELQLKKKEVK